MPEQATNGVLRLADGRSLGYAEYGDSTGKPLFYFHGHPGSRLEARIGGEPAARRGIRVIAIDRPGYGRSPFVPGRTLLDWPDDVVAVADTLGIDRLAVLGSSGGGPYALACAFRMRNRLTAVGIVSGTGPFDAPDATKGMRWRNRLGFKLGGRLPWLARLIMWSMARQVRKDPERVVTLIGRAMSAPDRLLLSDPGMRGAFVDIVTEAFRSGSRGAAWDLVLLARPWGFRLQDIGMDVQLWQGEEDVLVPPAMGRYLAATLPNCRANFCPGEGHLLLMNRLDEIQAALFPP